MVADRVDLPVIKNRRAPGAQSKRIAYPHNFYLEFGAGETFGGTDLVLNVRVGGRDFPFLRIGGSIERELFFIKRFQGGSFRRYVEGLDESQIDRLFKQVRRAVSNDLGIYPREGMFLAYLVLLFGYHRTKIGEVWNLCLNLGDQSRPTFHVDSPIDSLVEQTPGWQPREAFILGGNRSIKFLKRADLAQALASLSAKERKGVFAMAAEMATVSSDFLARQEPWEDIRSLLA